MYKIVRHKACPAIRSNNFVYLKKQVDMSTAEIKLKIFREIDSFEERELNEFYGILSNFINSKRDLNDWDSLSTDQKEGILKAINQIDAGKGISHDKVISKFKKKYTNA